MRYETLGSPGLEVPVLFLGCGNFGGIGSLPELFGLGDDQETAFAVMDAALAAGVRMFDTANSYGGGVSEDWIGQWLASRGTRDDVLLTTKVASPVGPRPEDRGLSRAHIRTQIEASLGRLRTDRIDLYVAHGPDESTPIAETVAAFDELVREGKIGHYGLSNVDRAMLEEALAAVAELGVTGPVNLQCGYNLLDRAESASFELCARAGIGFTAYSPLAGGLLTGKYRVDQPPPPGSRLALRPPSFGDLSRDDLFAALGKLAVAADGYGMALATLALAWGLADPGVTALVVGPRSPAQLKTMCDAVDVRLTEAQRAELVRMVAGE
ncbi:MAG TPA: aldo/keto reductase [Pseudonocardiaceae bacterium]|nr:aldo/keto reductase [Pseudonocardiaceae bacterium]